jgi:C-terminal processing protease CtpA/Prc
VQKYLQKKRWAQSLAIGLTIAVAAGSLIVGPGVASVGESPEALVAPQEHLRLKGLAEVWGMVYYFHPALRDPEKQAAWETELLYVIPAVEAAETLDEYAMALQAMVAKLGDEGTTILFLDEISESGQPHATSLPFRLRWLDDRAVISAVDTTAPGTEALAVGMEVISIDGVSVREFLAKWLPVASGRTEALKHSWVFDRLLRGRPGSVATIASRTASDDDLIVDLPRPDIDWDIPLPSLIVNPIDDGRYVHVALPSVLCVADRTPGIYSLYDLVRRYTEAVGGLEYEGVILDLRAGAVEFGSSLHVDVPLPHILGHFVEDPWATATGYAYRIHEGLRDDALPLASHSYRDLWGVVAGTPFELPVHPTCCTPLVVLVDQGSYPSVAEYLAPLQQDSRVVVVGGQGTQPMRRSYVCSVPGGLGFQLRLSIPWNGGGEASLPMVLKEPSPEDLRQGRDVALERALAILGDWEDRGSLSLSSAPPIGQSLFQRPLAGGTQLTKEERLLGLFKLWNAIRYFYPFPEMIDGDWDDTLAEFIPRVLEADDDAAYYHELQHLMGRINDGHAFLGKGFPPQYRPPIEIQEIEGKAVIVSVDRNQSAQNPDLASLDEGMVIIEVDEKPIADCIEDRLEWVPGSSIQHRKYWAHKQLLTGPYETLVKLRVEDREGDTGEAVLARTMKTLSQDPSPTWGWLDDELGFIDLTRIDTDELEQAMNDLRGAEGLVVDLRGYPSHANAGKAVDFLTDREAIVVQLRIPIVDSPDEDQSGWKVISQSGGPGAIEAFEGVIVVLTDERAVSAAEHVQFLLADDDRILIVGEPTAGTNGTITYVEIPGPAYAGFTGMEVLHADGRPFQGIGIIPDVIVHPTIEGIREGRDEILEKGIEVLRERIASRE